MTDWNMSGLVLEGISGTGKTTLINSMLRTNGFTEKTYLSSIILSEHHTQRVLEKKEREQGLTREDNIRLLNTHVNYISSLYSQLDRMSWCRKESTSMRIPYLLERFHLTHVFHYSHIGWEDVREIDEKLAALDCRLCVLTIDRPSILQRVIGRKDEAWQNYISRFGTSADRIADHFEKQQNDLLELTEKTALPVLQVDTSLLPPAESTRRVIEFWNICS